MQTLWFILVAFMLTMYVLLDGFDLGAGVIHLFVARTNEERRHGSARHWSSMGWKRGLDYRRGWHALFLLSSTLCF